MRGVIGSRFKLEYVSLIKEIPWIHVIFYRALRGGDPCGAFLDHVAAVFVAGRAGAVISLIVIAGIHLYQLL